MDETEVDGLLEVNCRDCGENLGYQQAGTEIIWESWEHNRCPVKIATAFEITRVQYDRLLDVLGGCIASCYLEVPVEAQARRAKITAGYAMEVLARFGYVITPKTGTVPAEREGEL